MIPCDGHHSNEARQTAIVFFGCGVNDWVNPP